MKKRFEKFLRVRYIVALLIASALMLAVVGEMSYQRIVTTLRSGIALTEARIGSARILQLLSDAEAAQLGYLLTGKASYLEPLEQAERELRGNKKVFDFIALIGPTGPQDSQQIYDMAMLKFGEIGPTLILAGSGDREGALALLDNQESKLRTQTMRARFDSKFNEAAVLQEGARQTIYDALLFNRSAVLLLSLLIAVGLYWYWRKLQQLDLQRHTRQRWLETLVAHKTSELRTLAGYLQTVREDEKSYLARELHDELGGLLTAAKLTLARMRVKLSGDVEMLERIEQITTHLNGGIALKRRIVEDLRPSTLSALGLTIALETLCAETGRSLGIPIATAITEVQLNADAELGIFRIVQEALTNIGKYADATEVSVELRETLTDVVLTVEDNGHGFDLTTLQPGQHGLAGMRFRVESLSGTMAMQSAPGAGVRITVLLPKEPLSAGSAETHGGVGNAPAALNG